MAILRSQHLVVDMVNRYLLNHETFSKEDRLLYLYFNHGNAGKYVYLLLK